MSAASTPEATNRRAELLRIAGDLFAEKGFRNTTVRDIADAAGILSGSLYHHFDSKESMVDELLQSFQSELFAAYDEILASEQPARAKIEAAVRLSFAAIDQHHAEVAIFQNEADQLGRLERFSYLADRNKQSREVWMTLLREGISSGALRADLDLELAYRFVRDTVWVAVRWYRPGGDLTHDQVADQYLTILLDGIAS
ncbi:TetR/AcrR family transcriptional regulator [Nocardioides nematodiphilus]|uniref:TetR/AcrR family transcriptional regulator n=1 Tax=Nocardioides nematodiphilus TaxID=2849669 RepID=UPI001CD91B87|nr:TetR/AcrR family transcriptional regulator [Nocardioides nematodiphilus]MCA1982101.1 TetR/AcrR family transcriptional regulator [Nocardioides nematodiphilus]